MATRRTTTTKVEIPIQPSIGTNVVAAAAKLNTAPPTHSPFLPTGLEATLLALYPATLIFGSLFSTLHPAARHATYLPHKQSYDPASAPSYFAKKGNVFNVYFVKVGWFWITLAFSLLLFSHSALGPPLRPVLTRRRGQAILRYLAITTVWIAMTQWFFGAPLIDRTYRWTGGKCAQVFADGAESALGRAEKGDMREALTHAACRAIGGQWRGGHDISGHVFLLIIGSAMLWLEILPAVLRMEGLGEARRVRDENGRVRRAGTDPVEQPVESNRQPERKTLGLGGKAALAVMGLSWWMLLMTAAYFHTWFEKLTGLLVAVSAIYAVYILPRGVPALRQVLGMPGI